MKLVSLHHVYQLDVDLMYKSLKGLYVGRQQERYALENPYVAKSITKSISTLSLTRYIHLFHIMHLV